MTDKTLMNWRNLEGSGRTIKVQLPFACRALGEEWKTSGCPGFERDTTLVLVRSVTTGANLLGCLSMKEMPNAPITDI